jgi:hypothetical protein
MSRLLVSDHIDLSIVDGDFVFSPNLTEKQLSSVQVIGQDIKHRILESGLLVKLIGLRNKNGISPIIVELELEIEKDERLVPGTIFITYNSDKSLSVKAETKQFGVITL